MLALRCAYSGGYGWFWYVSRIGTGQLVAAVGGGARPPQPGGHYTSQSHSLRLSHSWLHLLLYTQIVILRSQSFNMCIRCQRQRCRSNVGLVILSRHEYMHRIADRALRIYRQYLLLAPNLSTTTRSDINLTVCIRRSKRETLRLMPLDGWWNRAEQLSFGFRLYIHELDVPGLKAVVGGGVAWKPCDDPLNGGGGCCS